MSEPEQQTSPAYLIQPSPYRIATDILTTLVLLPLFPFTTIDQLRCCKPFTQS